MGKISPEFWQRMVDDMGTNKAAAFVAQDGNEPPDGYEAQAPTSPTTPGAQSEAPTPPSEGAGLSVMDLQRDLIHQQQQAAAERRQRFNDAAAELAKQKSGPSLSERLFQLSAAFASPTQTPGISGTLGNIMPLLAKQGADVRAGKTLDREKLQALRDKYADATGKDEEDVLSNRIKLAQLRDAQAKAKEPSIQMDAQGINHIVPKYAGIARPQNEAEFTALKLQPGDQYIMWNDPSLPPAQRAMVGRILTVGG